MLIVACTFIVLSLAALALLGWLLAHLRNQHQRISGRLDGLDGRLWARNAAVAPADTSNSLAGTIAPAFTLDALSGGSITLDSLLAARKPLLLLFTHPRCGPCYELLPDLDGWQRVYGDQLASALISGGERDTNLAMTSGYDLQPVLLQQDSEVADAFDVQQAPAAVVIDPSGVVSAGPRYGSHAIRKLVADTLGLEMPAPPARVVETAGVGQPAPRLRRPDLHGQAVEIGAPGNEPTLLLFWSPGCSGCQKLLPEIKEFEPAVERLRVVIVSRGPVGLNQDVGFRSPVVLDDDRSIAQGFGVTGTPAAVLVDGHGIVATQVARGYEGLSGVLQALATSFVPR